MLKIKFIANKLSIIIGIVFVIIISLVRVVSKFLELFISICSTKNNKDIKIIDIKFMDWRKI